MVETWELSPDWSRLLTGVHLEGGRMPDMTLKRVHDRSADESLQPDAP